jgi:CRP-like cAMP-binding protein
MLGSLPLFEGLTGASADRLAQRARERRLERNEILFQKGDASHSLFVVVYGQIKLALPAINGNEKVVELAGPQQCFGESALLSGNPYPVLAQAVADTLLLQISREVIDELLDSEPAFVRRMLTCLAQRSQLLIQDVETYTQQSGAQRVISFLQRHCLDDNNRNDCIAITLSAPKQVIASRLNLTPETLSRIFHDLTTANLIEVQGKTITINSLRRLQEYN